MRRKHVEPPAPPPEPANDQAGAVFTIPQLCERWQASRHTIHKAMKEGRLKAFRLGERVWRVSKDEVARFEREELGRNAA